MGDAEEGGVKTVTKKLPICHPSLLIEDQREIAVSEGQNPDLCRRSPTTGWLHYAAQRVALLRRPWFGSIVVPGDINQVLDVNKKRKRKNNPIFPGLFQAAINRAN